MVSGYQPCGNQSGTEFFNPTNEQWSVGTSLQIDGVPWCNPSSTRLNDGRILFSGGFTEVIQSTSRILSAAVTNGSPIADAGPDQELADADGDGRENVTLDASASTDPDGVIEKYVWYLNNYVIGEGPVISTTAPTGATTYAVEVTDDDQSTRWDEVTITVVDVVAPQTSATVSPSPNSLGWNRSPVMVILQSEDNYDGSGVDRMWFDATGAQSIPGVTFEGSKAWVSIGAEGTSTVHYYATDTRGNTEPTRSIGVKIDTTVPIVTPPQFRLPATFSATQTRPVTISWTGRDSRSGLQSFQLQMSRSGSVYQNVALSNPRATQTIVDAIPGQVLRFRIRATDHAGNRSAWISSALLSIIMSEETVASFSPTAKWTQATSPSFSGGSARYSTTTGSTASYSFTGRSIAWVSAVGPYSGIAEIWLDGLKVRTVDLYRPTAQRGEAVWVRNFSSTGDHTVQIRVTGNRNIDSLASRIDVDGFLVMK